MSLAPEPKALLSLIGGDSFFGSSGTTSNTSMLATNAIQAPAHNPWAQAGGIGSGAGGIGSYMSSFMPCEQVEAPAPVHQLQGMLNHMNINPQPYRPLTMGRGGNQGQAMPMPIPVPIPVPVPTPSLFNP